MRHLKRFQKPQKLIDKEVEWTNNFINSGNARPSSKQYGHPEIKEELGNLSFKKCFYSEVKFSHLSEAQVDHYIEVNEDKTKAFEWENLYLSHKDSNQGKISNINLPNSDCLNPFLNSDEEIEKSLKFEDEIILGIDSKGKNTILKYHLNKDIFNILRLKELQKFNKVLKSILFSIQNNSNKSEMSEIDKNLLKEFANSDRPFSLMFKLIIKKLPL